MHRNVRRIKGLDLCLCRPLLDPDSFTFICQLFRPCSSRRHLTCPLPFSSGSGASASENETQELIKALDSAGM